MVPTGRRTPTRRTRRTVGPTLASALVALLAARTQPASPPITTVAVAIDPAVDRALTPGCGTVTPDGTHATYTAPTVLPTNPCTLTAITTIPACGRRGSPNRQVHAFPERGTFRPALTVRQGDDVLARVTAEVEVAIRFVQISGGEVHTAALDRSGEVWGWGEGHRVGDGRALPAAVCATGSGAKCAQLGDGTTESIRPNPVRVAQP